MTALDSGMLARPDHVQLAWDRVGSPSGMPAVILHGGPGSGRSASARRLFDLARWAVWSFDQRGCGESRPHLADDPAFLAKIDLSAMIADIEALRSQSGVERWLVYGGSWGATLGLAYAAAHPSRVAALVLGPVTMTRRQEVDYAMRGFGRMNPDAWKTLCAAVPEVSAPLEDPSASFTLLQALDRALSEPERAPTVARAWAEWEVALAGGVRHPRWDDHRFRVAFARLVVRCWGRCAWLSDTDLLDAAARFDSRTPPLEGALVHAEVDPSATVQAADALARVWSGGRRATPTRAAHSLSNDVLFQAVSAEIARFEARSDLF